MAEENNQDVELNEPPPLCFLDGKFLHVDINFILELHENTEIPYQSNAKILKVFSTTKFNEFIYNDRFQAANFPMLFIAVMYAQNTSDEVVQTSITKKFNDNRPLILEIASSGQIYLNQNENCVSGDEFKANFNSTMDWITPENFNRPNFIEFLKSIVDCGYDLYLRIIKLYKLTTNFDGPEIWNFALCKKVIESSTDTKMLEAALDLPFNYHIGIKISESSEDLISHITPDGQSIIKKLITDLIQQDSPNAALLKFIVSNFKLIIDNMNFDHKKGISQHVFNASVNSENANAEIAKVFFFYLIEADFPFPDFPNDFNEVDFVGQNKTLDDRKQLHAKVISGDVKPWDLPLRFAKIAYDVNNKSILVRSLEAKNFEAYSYFQSCGLKAGINEELSKVLKGLTPQEHDKIFQHNLKNSVSDRMKLVKILVSKSRLNNHGNYLTPGEDDKHLQKIEEYFSYVFDSHEIMPKVFEIVAKNLAMGFQFDFYSEHVHQIHPEYINCWGVLRPEGCILIGAKCEDEMMIMQTIAHEMMHFVITVVYENAANPYFHSDIKRKQEIDQLVIDFENYPDICDKIIKRVYDAYDGKFESRELVVRPMEIIIRFRSDQERIQKCREEYMPLFTYFDAVLEDIKNYDEVKRNGLRNILLNFHLNEKYQLNTCKYFTVNNLKIDEVTQVLISDNPMLTTIAVCHKLREIYGNIFSSKLLIVSSETFPMLEAEYVKIRKSHPDARVVVLLPKETENFNEFLTKIFIDDITKFTVIASQETAPLIQDFLSTKNVLCVNTNVSHSWMDLNSKIQKEILMTKIQFQNKAVFLHDLAQGIHQTFFDSGFLRFYYDKVDLTTNNNEANETDDIYFKRFLMKNFREVFKLEDRTQIDILHQIEERIQEDPTPEEREQVQNIQGKPHMENIMRIIAQKILLVMRDECVAKNTTKQIDLDNIKEEELLKETDKYVIISDIAGNGKSSLLKSMQKRFCKKKPLSWVHFVDLKLFIQDFEDMGEEVNFKEFFKNKIMRDSKEHEKLIFDHFYEYRRVIILLDGYDEVSPKYSEPVLKLAQSFNVASGQLWISTRPHLNVDIKESLEVKDSFTLKRLTDVEQKNYFLKYLNKRNAPGDHEKIADKLFEHFSTIVKKDFNFIGVPQLLGILAKASIDENGKFDERLLEKLTPFKIYKKMIDRKLEVWSKEVGKLGEDATSKSQMGMTFYIIHKILAMKCYFEDNKNFCGELWSLRQWTEEEICRCGFILRFENGMPIFIHEAYKELFASCFIIDHFDTKDADWEYFKELFGYLTQFLINNKFQVIRMFIEEALDVIEQPSAEMYTKFTSIFDEILEEQYAVEISTEDSVSYEIQSGFGVLFYPTRERHERLVNMILKIIEEMSANKLKAILKYSPCVQTDYNLFNSDLPGDHNFSIFEKILRMVLRRFGEDNEILTAFISQQFKEVVIHTILNSKSDETFDETVRSFDGITDRSVIEEIFAFNDRNRKYKIFMDVENSSRLQRIWIFLKHSGLFTSEELINYVINEDFSAFYAFAYKNNKENYDFLYTKLLELLREDQYMMKEKFEICNLKIAKQSLDLPDGVEGLQNILWRKISHKQKHPIDGK